MDHLPVFGHSVGAYPRAPFLCKEKCDNLPFAQYQDRRGFDVQRLYNRDFSQRPPEEIASFLQTWLYFGSLNEIFGFQQPVNPDYFVEADSLGLRICTKHLNSYISTWAGQMDSLATKSSEECRAALRRVGICLNTIHKIHHSLFTCSESPLPWEVTLSFAILGCTIDHALQWLWGLGRGRNWGLDNAAAIRMFHFGWCPRDIAVAREFLSEIPMYCTSYIARQPTSHDQWECSQKTCRVNQIDERAYVTKHRTPGCQCAHIESLQDEICRILDKRDVPAISLTPRRQHDGSRTFDMKVREGGAMIHYYIAISHVWSDGLRNPTRNSLLLCQLEFLYDLLVDTSWDEVYVAMETMGEDFEYNNEGEKKAIEGIGRVCKALVPGMKRLITPIREFRDKPVSNWIDTLCVPLEKHYRKLAIARMKDVYAKAVFAVVLDSELQSLESRRCSQEEFLVRIGLSGWMRRAWTFQEGVLATNRLRFLFADGLNDLPLWQKETNPQGEADYIFPRFSETRKVNVKVAEWGAQHGADVPSHKVPQSRLEEEAERKKSFAPPDFMLEEVKQFFVGMEILWSRASGYEKPSDLVHRMIAAWESLRLRATSHEEDKLICFAVACAFGHKERRMIQELLSYSPEQRMKVWIQTQPVVPTGLLFLSGPRYNEKGFLWVPRGVWREPLVDKDFAAREQGSDELVFRKPGFMLYSAECHLNTFLISDQITSLRYLVIPQRSTVAVAASTATFQSCGQLGIVMMQMVGQRQPEYDLYKEIGALLSNVRKVDDKIHGDYICRVEVRLFTEEQSNGLAMILARSLDKNQGWIIS